MNTVIFGDNQFFGINHMSEHKAQAQLERFASLESIIEVLDAAYDVGIRRFMFTTHDRVGGICDHLRSRPERYADVRIYPAMPYGHKYATLVTEKGLLGAVSEVVRGSGSASSVITTLLRAGRGMVQQDLMEMMRLLVDAEMQMFRGLHVEAIFLQNVVTDLLYGLGATRVFREFVAYAREKYEADAGFITMNLPGLVGCLRENGLERPLVCASFNKTGYLMNPSRCSYEDVVRSGDCRFIAMSVFASGAIRPVEAVEYVYSHENVQGVLFGASSKQHIAETLELLQQENRDMRQFGHSRGVATTR